jgi:PAS domain S-box-containing protein
MQLLIVDDDHFALKLLRHSLAPSGYEILTARDGEEAWEMLQANPCRIVISDWVMPRSDGVTLCRRIREAEFPFYIYVILLTAWEKEIDVVEALGAGADDVLSKPFDPGELRVRLRNAVRVLNLQELGAAQRALETSERRLQGMFNKMRDGILIIDPVRDLIHDVNPAGCCLFEQTREQLLAGRASDVHAEQNGRLRDLLNSIQSDEHGAVAEILCRTKSGRIFPAALSASVIDHGDRECILATIRDISDRKAAEQQQQAYTESLEQANHRLRESQQLLEAQNARLRDLYAMAHTFVDNVSHEFRTPLTVIKEYADLISEGAVGPIAEEQQRFMSVIADRADDLNTMVDDMLDGSKLDNGMMAVIRQPVQIREIIEHVRPVLERKALNKGVDLTIDVERGLPDLFVDDAKVGRILVNLAVNAIKFSGEPGVVRVWAQADSSGPGVVLGVTDNGAGIDSDRQSEIFERFKQLGGSIRGSCKGFGLGLSIAKELVDLNLGELQLESQPGLGTTFRCSLPPYDPAEVLGRYLRRVQALNRSGDISVTLFSAEIAEQVDLALAQETNDFLHHILQRNDLIFRTMPHRWAILAPVFGTSLTRMLQKLERSVENENRNRPRGPLPAVDFKVLVTCGADDGSEDLLDRMLALWKPCAEPALANYDFF